MKLVAVTSCPTGIAHSQMAAENLETRGTELGHEIKVEVQGAMGAENELTADDIAAADAVVITADTAVQTDRFEGKPVVKGSVKDGVNRADEMIERAVEAAESGGTGVIDAAGGEGGAGGDGGDADADAESAAASPSASADRPRGGNPEKGVFRRLRRWLAS